MKKCLCAFIAIIMMATNSMTAFATTIENVDGSAAIDVKGKYVNAVLEDVYSVDVTWGAMEFDYYEGGQKWNTESHKWEANPEDTEGWTVNNNSNTITLVNNSSKEVDASFVFAENAEYTALVGSFSYNSAVLTSALELEFPAEDTAAKEYVVTFTPDGAIPDTHSTTTYAKIGVITVTLG